MQKIKTVLTAFGFSAALLVTAPVFADGHLEKAIEARKAVMSLYSFNLGQLGAMAKGNVAYDAAAASAAAGNLAALAALDQGALWPKGSDAAAMPDKTRAKAEIWSTYPEVNGKSKALAEASVAMAKVAGDGLPALQAAIGDVGKTCGGCHKPFRVPK
ncbi:c-type cytochrome [Nisaea nitritireducens]|uniref:c-type cytochrome n=1 Tax=Nisaea nitritireducens TaxID=568392 RepID=UPI00186751E1|nr:cytochrome c [Nisaea nitritireducens]